MTITEFDDRNDEGLRLLEPRYSQSLQRGLSILNCYSPERPLLGVADLAGMTGISPSTTHRYVTTLEALGYLRKGARRKYRLSMGVTRLGMEAMNQISLQEHARPILHELWQRTHFTVSLAVLEGSALVYVNYIWGSRRSESQSPKVAIGTDQPAHNTALGKLLLAQLPIDLRRDAISQLTLTKTGPKTITSKKRLHQELIEIYDEGGLAQADEELAARLVEIAGPVRNGSDEVVAAVSLTTTSRIIDVEVLARELGPHLIATADRISARLGHRRNDEPRSYLLGDFYGAALEEN